MGPRYGCKVRGIFQEDVIELTDVIGNHLPSQTNSDVVVLSIEFLPTLVTFPSGIENFFPSILAMQVFETNLSSISSAELQPFPELLVLVFEVCNITSLDSDVFVFNSKLQVLGVERSPLATVGYGLFGKQEELEFALFGGNDCIDFRAFDRSQLPELEKLLAYQCPLNQPEEICPGACVERINFLEDEVKELRWIISAYEERFESIENRLNGCGAGNVTVV